MTVTSRLLCDRQGIAAKFSAFTAVSERAWKRNDGAEFFLLALMKAGADGGIAVVASRDLGEAGKEDDPLP